MWEKQIPDVPTGCLCRYGCSQGRTDAGGVMPTETVRASGWRGLFLELDIVIQLINGRCSVSESGVPEMPATGNMFEIGLHEVR